MPSSRATSEQRVRAEGSKEYRAGREVEQSISKKSEAAAAALVVGGSARQRNESAGKTSPHGAFALVRCRLRAAAGCCCCSSRRHRHRRRLVPVAVVACALCRRSRAQLAAIVAPATAACVLYPLVHARTYASHAMSSRYGYRCEWRSLQRHSLTGTVLTTSTIAQCMPLLCDDWQLLLWRPVQLHTRLPAGGRYCRLDDLGG